MSAKSYMAALASFSSFDNLQLYLSYMCTNLCLSSWPMIVKLYVAGVSKIHFPLCILQPREVYTENKVMYARQILTLNL